jgi:RNA polymerase sigma-70 factor (ECF subfamily)
MLHATAFDTGGVTAPRLLSVSGRVADPFERLFRDEYRKVVSIAYRVLQDQASAEDVAQEVFLDFHRSRSPLWERAAGWLHAAAAHTALNRLRGDRRRSRRESATFDPTPTTDPAEIVERSERRRRVRAALGRLPERSAAVLALRYSGLSYVEIAAAMGTRTNQVGTMLRRAEAALRKEVEDEASR